MALATVLSSSYDIYGLFWARFLTFLSIENNKKECVRNCWVGSFILHIHNYNFHFVRLWLTSKTEWSWSRATKTRNSTDDRIKWFFISITMTTVLRISYLAVIPGASILCFRNWGAFGYNLINHNGSLRFQRSSRFVYKIFDSVFATKCRSKQINKCSR